MAERSSSSSSSSPQQPVSSAASSRTVQPAPTAQSTEDTVFKAVDDCIEQLYTHFAKLENSPELADTLSIVTMLKERMVIMKAQSAAKKAVTTSEAVSSEDESKE
jgi:uncharacterized membrane protein